jgi:hypothetical protein
LRKELLNNLQLFYKGKRTFKCLWKVWEIHWGFIEKLPIIRYIRFQYCKALYSSHVQIYLPCYPEEFARAHYSGGRIFQKNQKLCHFTSEFAHSNNSRTQIWNSLGFFRKLDWNSSGILRDSLKFMEFQKNSGTNPFVQLFPPRIVALEQSWFCFFK